MQSSSKGALEDNQRIHERPTWNRVSVEFRFCRSHQALEFGPPVALPTAYQHSRVTIGRKISFLKRTQ